MRYFVLPTSELPADPSPSGNPRQADGTLGKIPSQSQLCLSSPTPEVFVSPYISFDPHAKTRFVPLAHLPPKSRLPDSLVSGGAQFLAVKACLPRRLRLLASHCRPCLPLELALSELLLTKNELGKVSRKWFPFSTRTRQKNLRRNFWRPLCDWFGGRALSIVPREAARFPAITRFSDHAVRIRANSANTAILSAAIAYASSFSKNSIVLRLTSFTPSQVGKPRRYASPPKLLLDTQQREASVSKYKGESSPSNWAAFGRVQSMNSASKL